MTILFGALGGRVLTDRMSDAAWICGGDACIRFESSKILLLRCFPPKSELIPPPLVLGREPSGLPWLFGEGERRCGENAPLSLPAGDALRLKSGATAMVWAWTRGKGAASSAEAVECERVESSVSEVIRGEDSVW